MTWSTWWYQLAGEERIRSRYLPCHRDEEDEARQRLEKGHERSVSWCQSFASAQNIVDRLRARRHR